MQGSSKRSTGYPRGGSVGTPAALRALEPRIGQSPRDEKGRSSLPRQQSSDSVGGVKGALLAKVGQAGVDAIFDAAKRPKRRRRARKAVAA